MEQVNVCGEYIWNGKFPSDLGIILDNTGFLPSYSAFENLRMIAAINKKVSDEENGGGQIDVPTEAPEEKISELIALKQVVGELDPRDRSLIVMRFFKSRTQTQTAEVLGMTQVQVSRREKKILQELKAKLS